MRIRTRRTIIIGIIGLLIFGPGVYHLIKLSFLQRSLDHRLNLLEQEQIYLNDTLTRLETDPDYVEGLIRTTFHYSKPNEYVIPIESESFALGGPQALSELATQ